MPIISGKVDRVFVAEINGAQVELEDPNPNFTVEEILDFYVPQYPQLLNSKVISKGIENDKAKFEFATVAGTKG